MSDPLLRNQFQQLQQQQQQQKQLGYNTKVT